MNCNPSWWVTTKTTPECNPIDALNTLTDCLRQGDPVPEPAASLLLDSLLRYMAGTRFEQALGLQATPNGKRTALQTAALERRDSKIRALADLLPGDCRKHKAEAVKALLDAPRGQSCGIREADLIAEDLRQRYGQDLPTSVRHIQRVLGRQ